MTRKIEKVSKKLRLIEKEIDSYFCSNPLTNLSFAEAGWHLLTVFEDSIFLPEIRLFQNNASMNIQEFATRADNFIVTLQYPLRWLWETCNQSGSIPIEVNGDYYAAGFSLWKLSQEYNAFDSAYTLASNGLIKLNVRNRTIFPSTNIYNDLPFEAYDRLVRVDPVLNSTSLGNLFHLISPLVSIHANRFNYTLDNELINETRKIIQPVFNHLFKLPENWMFKYFSIFEFREMMKVLISITYLHYFARISAATKQCVGFGCNNSLFLINPCNLIQKIYENTHLESKKIEKFINYLTFGSNEIIRLDPSIQPLIPLNDNCLALSPNLIINSAVERNFCVLLNRIEDERDIYERFSQQKETMMKSEIKQKFLNTKFRFEEGNVRFRNSSHEIDLILISDKEFIALVFELKWFIKPSEIREVIEKANEIKIGVNQLLNLKNAIDKTPTLFQQRFNLNEDYQIYYVVASANSIGTDWAQNNKIPVINLDHLINKINATGSLENVISWLTDRSYLPIKGLHYKARKIYSKIGKWRLKWYGLETLINDLYY